MNIKELKDLSFELVKAGRIKDTLELLEKKLSRSSAYFDKVLHESCKYSQLHNDFIQSLIKYEERDIQLSKNRLSVINIIKDITESDLATNEENKIDANWGYIEHIEKYISSIKIQNTTFSSLNKIYKETEHNISELSKANYFAKINKNTKLMYQKQKCMQTANIITLMCDKSEPEAKKFTRAINDANYHSYKALILLFENKSSPLALVYLLKLIKQMDKSIKSYKTNKINFAKTKSAFSKLDKQCKELNLSIIKSESMMDIYIDGISKTVKTLESHKQIYEIKYVKAAKYIIFKFYIIRPLLFFKKCFLNIFVFFKKTLSKKNHLKAF